MKISGLLRNQWDRALAVGAVVVGIVSIVLGWLGVSGTLVTGEQLPYLASGAMAGLFCLGVAATLWLSADLRDEHRKLQEMHEWMQREAERHPVDPTTGQNGNGAATAPRPRVRPTAPDRG